LNFIATANLKTKIKYVRDDIKLKNKNKPYGEEVKMKNSLKKLLSGVLVALVAIIAAGGLQALASDTYPVLDREGAGTPANPEQAVVTKHLEMPIGTTPPNTTFTFDFTALSGTGLPSNGPENVVLSTTAGPAVGSVDAVFTTGTPTEVQPAPRADVIRATVHTPNALAGITWPNAGVFVYQVTERTNTFTNTAREHMYFDTIQYNLFVTIGEAADGTFYVRGSHAWERDPVTGDNVGPKLNPNPWRPGPGAIEGGSDLIFINRFIRRTDDITTTPPTTRPSIPGPGTSVPGPGGSPNPGVPGPNDPNDLTSALIVSKRVTGSMASASSTFTFTGALTHSTLVNEVMDDFVAAETTYGPVVAFVYHLNSDGDFVRGRRAPAGTLPVSYTFTPGAAAAEFQLRHGEVLIFERIPIGNIFVVRETNSLTYVPRIDLMVNGAVIGSGAGLTAPGQIGTAEVGTPPHRIGEQSNIAAFTNTNDPAPITGLITNNLPIILVTAGAIGLVAVTVVSKKRRVYA